MLPNMRAVKTDLIMINLFLGSCRDLEQKNIWWINEEGSEKWTDGNIAVTCDIRVVKRLFLHECCSSLASVYMLYYIRLNHNDSTALSEHQFNINQHFPDIPSHFLFFIFWLRQNSNHTDTRPYRHTVWVTSCGEVWAFSNMSVIVIII